MCLFIYLPSRCKVIYSRTIIHSHYFFFPEKSSGEPKKYQCTQRRIKRIDHGNRKKHILPITIDDQRPSASSSNYFFFPESSSGDSKKSQSTERTIKQNEHDNKKKESISITIDGNNEGTSASLSSERTNYSYNKKGQLLVDGYPFVRTAVRGALNTSILWRCAETKKFKCRARVKTLGRELQIIDIQHNHEARKEKQFNAIIWNEK